MIAVDQLTKTYGNIQAISGLTFSIQKGEIVGLLGHNGAGKTTTIKLLTGYMPPSSGNATIDGHSLLNDTLPIRRLIGYLPEHNPLESDLTVTEYLEYVGGIRNIAKRSLSAKISRVVSLCQLESVRRYPISACSKGFRQRVGLAQALIHEPKLLFLDEPMVGLDPNQIFEIRQLIQQLRESTTIVLCSHILSEVEATCDRAIILKNGKIIANDSPEALCKSVSSPQIYTLSLNELGAETPETIRQFLMSTFPNVSWEFNPTSPSNRPVLTAKSDIDGRSQWVAALVKKGVGVTEVSLHKLGLEAAFLALNKASA